MAVMGMAVRVTMVVVVIVGMRMRHGGRTENASENRALQGATAPIYVTL